MDVTKPGTWKLDAQTFMKVTDPVGAYRIYKEYPYLWSVLSQVPAEMAFSYGGSVGDMPSGYTYDPSLYGERGPIREPKAGEPQERDMTRGITMGLLTAPMDIQRGAPITRWSDIMGHEGGHFAVREEAPSIEKSWRNLSPRYNVKENLNSMMTIDQDMKPVQGYSPSEHVEEAMLRVVPFPMSDYGKAYKENSRSILTPTQQAVAGSLTRYLRGGLEKLHAEEPGVAWRYLAKELEKEPEVLAPEDRFTPHQLAEMQAEEEARRSQERGIYNSNWRDLVR